MNRKELLIIIGVLIFGAVYQLTTEGQILFFQRCSKNPDKLLLAGKYIKYHNKELKYQNIENIEIDNPAGRITIKSSPSRDTIIRSAVLVYNTGKKSSQVLYKKIKINTKIVNRILKINLSEKIKFPLKKVRIHYELLVPEKTNITLNNKYGNIDIRNLSAKIKIFQKYGRILLEDIDGEIECSGQKIKLISIKSVKSVKLKIRSSNVQIIDCNKVIVFGKHSRLRLKWIKEYTYIENTYKPISITNTQGEIQIRSKACEIDLQSIDADSILIKNSYKDIKINKMKAKSIALLISHNDLFLSFYDVLKLVSIKGENSNIFLKFPQKTKASLFLDNKYGEIFNKRKDKINVLSQNYKSILSRKHNKPQIIITNTYGNITLENL